MKKILTIALLTIAPSIAFANGYCDSRGNQQQVAQCYNNAVQMENAQVNSMIQRLQASTKLGDADKKRVNEIHNARINQINAGCNNTLCTYSQLKSYKTEIIANMSKFW